MVIRNKTRQSPLESDFVRPELNLEKWCIWQPAKSQNKLNEIIIKRTIVNPDGSRLEAKVEVSPNLRYGPPTTETQKVYYALIRLWEKVGKPKRLYFSRRSLAKELGKDWGSAVNSLITLSLYQLATTLFIWTNSYYNNITKKTIQELNSFSVLCKLSLTENLDTEISGQDRCFVEFHELVYNNLLTNYTKPLIFSVIKDLTNGIAQILYTHLDLLVSSNKNKTYERKTKELFFEDLQLRAPEYQKLSFRIRTLNNILPKLENKPISIGGNLSLCLEPTQDGKDLKLIVRVLNDGQVSNEIVNTAQKEIVNTAQKKGLNAKQLVLYFLEKFGLSRPMHASELAYANELINTYQLTEQQGLHFVEFSKSEADKTNFKVANFNGIARYLNSALAELEKKNTSQSNAANKCAFCKDFSGRISFRSNIDSMKFSIKCPHSKEQVQIMEKTRNAVALIYCPEFTDPH
jgi:hypothetical protein